MSWSRLPSARRRHFERVITAGGNERVPSEHPSRVPLTVGGSLAIAGLLAVLSACADGVWVGSLGEVTATLDGEDVSLDEVGVQFDCCPFVMVATGCSEGTDCCQRMGAGIFVSDERVEMTSECL